MRPAAVAACAVVTCLAASIHLSADTQGPIVVAEGELTLAIKTSANARMVPQTLKLLISLTADGKGVVAMPAHQIAGFSVPVLASVTWQRDSADFVLKGVGMGVGNSTLAFDNFRLRLDSNAIDRGIGTASGQMRMMLGDTVNGGAFAASMTLAADRLPPTSALSPTWSDRGEPLLPREPLRVTFSEPVKADAIPANLRLMSGANVVPSRIDVVSTVYGLAGHAVITPLAAAVPNARLTVDARGIADMFGNVVSEISEALQVIAAPGNALDNASFELGLQQWISSGAIVAAGAERGVAPQSGVAQAVLKTPSRLVGRIAVPASASTLAFRVAAFSEGAGFDAGRSAVVWLLTDGERHSLFDAGASTQAKQIAPTNVTADIVRWRNREVMIVAEVRGSGYFGMNYHTLLLDDFSVR